jgi:L,D-peptidoglycan transpeptidase YkuD (ErfK/YbiS/YcfS/YnhG family)
MAGCWRLRCALGKGGVRNDKREGDRATPRGRFRMRCLWFRDQGRQHPLTRLPLRRTKASDGWCDAPAHARYNKPVRLPFAASHERMFREDRLYDLVVEIGWNDQPAIKGRGSAIFMHIARPGYTPTEGCVALSYPDLRRLLTRIGPRTRIDIR